MHYRTFWVVRHVMPEDRPAHVTTDLTTGDIVLSLHQGFVNPQLAHTMAEFSRGFAESNLYDLDPVRDIFKPDKPELIAWFEGVDQYFLGDQPMQVFYGGRSPAFFEILVDKDMIDPAMIRELNDHVMPTVCGLLVPFGHTDSDRP